MIELRLSSIKELSSTIELSVQHQLMRDSRLSCQLSSMIELRLSSIIQLQNSATHMARRLPYAV